MVWITTLARHRVILTILATMLMAVMLVPSTFAQTTGDQAEADRLFGIGYGSTTGLGDRDVRTTISGVINVALSLLGIVALVIILVGGFQWMTAGGNEEKVTEARKRIFAGIIGLAIILSAYAVARFVIVQLGRATGAGTFSNIE